MKRLAFLLAAALLLSALYLPIAALTGENYVWFDSGSNEALPKNEHIGGDTNGDGAVNLRDVIGLMRYLGGAKQFATRDAIDVNNDGVVDVADVLYLLHYTVGDHDALGSLLPGDDRT